MGSDSYDTVEELAKFASQGQPPTGIGSGSEIIKSILDKNTQVGENVVVRNTSGIKESDTHAPCLIRDGIPILIKDGVLPDHFQMP